MAEWQQVPANSRNMEPRSMTANRTEKTRRHWDINSPGKNGKHSDRVRAMEVERIPQHC